MISPLELLLYLIALVPGLLVYGLLLLMLRSMDRADARRQDLERRKVGTLL